jgi:hypothetical protein
MQRRIIIGKSGCRRRRGSRRRDAELNAFDLQALRSQTPRNRSRHSESGQNDGPGSAFVLIGHQVRCMAIIVGQP